VNAPEPQVTQVAPIEFSLNGQAVVAAQDETILQTADRYGIEIPRLCYKEGMRADGNCRSCMVEIQGERALAPSCCRFPLAGMDVSSASARALHSQKMIVELLCADVPDTIYKPDSELAYWKRKLGIGKPRSRPARNRLQTCRIRRWRSISTPAFNARAACAHAAKCRSTT